MIRSELTIKLRPCLTNSNEEAYPLIILSPKKADRCSYCRCFMQRNSWFSISPLGAEVTFYCSVKCMWITCRASYRKFETFKSVGLLRIAKPIKQNLPRSLAETTSSLKFSQVVLEISASNKSMMTRISIEGEKIKRRKVFVVREVRRRLDREDWMNACRLLRNVVRKKPLTEIEEVEKSAQQIEIAFDN